MKIFHYICNKRILYRAEKIVQTWLCSIKWGGERKAYVKHSKRIVAKDFFNNRETIGMLWGGDLCASVLRAAFLGTKDAYAVAPLVIQFLFRLTVHCSITIHYKIWLLSSYYDDRKILTELDLKFNVKCNWQSTRFGWHKSKISGLAYFDCLEHAWHIAHYHRKEGSIFFLLFESNAPSSQKIESRDDTKIHCESIFISSNWKPFRREMCTLLAELYDGTNISGKLGAILLIRFAVWHS